MTDRLKRNNLETDRYEYLSKEDSILYDMVKDRDDVDGTTIRMLLEDKAKASRGSHGASRY